MHQLLLPIILIFLSIQSFSQTLFEPGYFIDDQNQRVECFIKNADWKNNPSSFIYKLKKSSPIKEASIDGVKEFGLMDGNRYRKESVEIDRAPLSFYNLNPSAEPQFQQETHFLEILFEGSYNLYRFHDQNIMKYFFSNSQGKIVQLLNIKYLNEARNLWMEKKFKQQLMLEMQCDKVGFVDLENLVLREDKLVDFFESYHRCMDQPIQFIKPNLKPEKLKIFIRPGIRNAQFGIDDINTDARDVAFSNQMEFSLGAELEYVLPYFNNKLAFTFEPTYHAYKASGVTDFPVQNVSVDYQSIEFALGCRFYSFLDRKNKIFLNINALADVPLNAQIQYESNIDLNILTGRSFAGGIGFKHGDQWGMECRYGFGRSLRFREFFTSTEDYNFLAFILSYQIL